VCTIQKVIPIGSAKALATSAALEQFLAMIEHLTGRPFKVLTADEMSLMNVPTRVEIPLQGPATGAHTV